jgi:hypothetical protein
MSSSKPVEKCLDCEGVGKYQNGHTCKSCGGSGHVPIGTNSWDAYEEDGPMDLEDQLDAAFARADRQSKK